MGIYIKKIKLYFLIAFSFIILLFGFNQYALGKESMDLKLNDNTEDLLKGQSNINLLENSQTYSLKKASIKPQIGYVKWHISNEYINGKSRYTFHVDKLIGKVKPSKITVSLKVMYRNFANDNKKVYAEKMLYFTKSEIKSNAKKYIEVKPKTAFINLGGYVMPTVPKGTATLDNIKTSTIVTNKVNQYFPNYVDSVSKKSALYKFSNKWKVLKKSPSWNGRKKYIKDFEKKYGKQSVNYWASREIHHIQPRKQSGGNEFSNLMPVEKNPHKLLTKWFRNY